MPSLPPLKALQAFNAVGRLGSVTAAARELKVSPGAISQQVRKIEDYLGVTLLERNGRRMEMTRWGKLYHSEIAKGFDQLGHAQKVISRARNETGLVLSSLTSVVNKWIGRRIFDWQSSHPQATVRLVGTEIEPRLGEDKVDFRIFYGSGPSHEHFRELFTDWVVPACAPGLVVGKALKSPADILKYPLLHVVWDEAFAPAPSWSDWARHIGADYADRDNGLSFTLSSSAIDAAVMGRGFVLAQLSMAADELESGRLVIPFDRRLPLSEPYRLAWNRASLQKPFAKEFREWIIATARKQAMFSSPEK